MNIAKAMMNTTATNKTVTARHIIFVAVLDLS